MVSSNCIKKEQVGAEWFRKRTSDSICKRYPALEASGTDFKTKNMLIQQSFSNITTNYKVLKILLTWITRQYLKMRSNKPVNKKK